MRSINPSCKFFGILVPAVALSLFFVPELNFIVLAACIVTALLSKVPAKQILAIMCPALLLAVGIFITAYRFSSETTLGLQTGIFTDIQIVNSLLLSGRLLAFSSLGMLFVLTTDKIDFVRSLNIQLKLSAKFAYGTIAAWGMFPKMIYEYSRTRAAFRARGIRTSFISPALLLPLLVKSVRWAEAIAIAMESKGFGETNQRTNYYEFKTKVMDIVFPFATTLAVIVLGIVLT